ncbi:MAG: TrmH family RNA methyltransferase, partial [Luteibaculum sp.]
MKQIDKLQEIYLRLSTHLQEERLERFASVVKDRTDYLHVVVEDIQYERNAGALIRTCDCFGVQQFSVIEQKFSEKVANKISRGSDKWVDVHVYDNSILENTRVCIEDLKAKGYHVVATTPHQGATLLQDFKVTKPTAFLFGTEVLGLSETALEMADESLEIPMFGFAESFNISVTAALVLNQTVHQLRKSNLPWKISPERTLELQIDWIIASLGDWGPGIYERILSDL